MTVDADALLGLVLGLGCLHVTVQLGFSASGYAIGFAAGGAVAIVTVGGGAS